MRWRVFACVAGRAADDDGISRGLPTTQELEDFARALPAFFNLLREPTDGQLLVPTDRLEVGEDADAIHVFALPEGLKFTFMNDSRRQLYVRRSIRELLSRIEEHRERWREGALGVVVNGNPGIGKSYSLNYFMLHYLALGKTVVFESVQKGLRWVLKPQCDTNGKVSIAVRRYKAEVAPLPEMERRGTIYLFDPWGKGGQAREPSGCQAFTIVCSSPNQAHFQQFLKDVRTRKIAPVWKIEELQAVRSHMERSGEIVPTEQELEDRYDIVGGIPRYVLDPKASKGMLENMVTQALAQIPADSVYQLHCANADGSTATARLSHKLLELKPTPTFDLDASYGVLSKFAAGSLVARAQQVETATAKKLSSVRGALGGIFFEAHMTHILQGKVALIARSLDTSEQHELDDWIVDFGTPALGVDDVWVDPGNMNILWPQRGNFPAIDAAIPGMRMLFSITINPKHDIKVHIGTYLDKIGAHEGSKAKLVFVTREEEFKKMTRRPIRKGTKVQEGERVDHINARMEQWVAYVKGNADVYVR